MYEAEISRDNPGLFLFLLDQSQSMDDAFGGRKEGIKKADGAADALNNILYAIVLRCSKGMEVRSYFDIGMIGYGREQDWVGPVFEGDLQGRDLIPTAELAEKPTRIEQREKTELDGAGSTVKVPVDFPIWISPVAVWNTPMCKTFEYAHGIVEAWCNTHPTAFPPIVINITDGESTDGDPMASAERLTSLSTQDGNVLLFNCHLSSQRRPTVLFPDSEDELPDQFAKKLFQMSSKLPEVLLKEASVEGFPVTSNSKGFAFNADLTDLIQFLDIGTRTAGKARDA